MNQQERDKIVQELREQGVGNIVSEDLLNMFTVKESWEQMISLEKKKAK